MKFKVECEGLVAECEIDDVGFEIFVFQAGGEWFAVGDGCFSSIHPFADSLEEGEELYGLGSVRNPEEGTGLARYISGQGGKPAYLIYQEQRLVGWIENEFVAASMKGVGQ